MCTYSILHQNSSGFVAGCAGCKQIKFAFGNISVNMKEIDFVNLCTGVGREVSRHQFDSNPTTRKIYLSLPGNKVEMVFSIEELNTFNDLLTESYLQNEINKLLQLH